MATRRIVILRLLRDSDDPIRRAELWREADKDDDFRKASGKKFWIEDFSWFMRDLISAGQVLQIKERNKVWYLITEKGLNYLLGEIDPNLLRQHVMRRIRYRVRRRFSWGHSDDEIADSDRLIAKLAERMEDGEEYVHKRYYTEIVNTNARRRDWGETEFDERDIAVAESYVGKIDREKLEGDILKEIARVRRRLEARDAYFGECIKCGRFIHRREAVKVANELAERLNVETGTVCCGCYDKLMGGESQVAEISA